MDNPVGFESLLRQVRASGPSMLRIVITNERQRIDFRHAQGLLHMGRLNKDGVSSVVLDDQHVSRSQLQLEELDGNRLRIENVGRSDLLTDSGTRLSNQQIAEVNVPVRISVGKTLIEIVPQRSDEVAAFDPSATLGVDAWNVSVFERRQFVVVVDSFPFPLAYSYSMLQSITEPTRLYLEQLRLAESVLAFLGSMALSALGDDQLAPLQAKFDGNVLGCWQGGISLGRWLDIALHGAELLSGTSHPFAQPLAGLELHKDRRGAGRLLRELISAKNNQKHDRGPKVEADFEEQSRVLGRTLAQLFAELIFLKDIQLRLVRDVNPHRRELKADVVFLNCRGAHPGFTAEKTVCTQSVRKGDLYLQTADGTLTPLYPFVQHKLNPQSKAHEFYFIDRLDQKKTGNCVAGLKSFETGSAQPDDDAGAELARLFPGS